ncbi:MAG: hypothetical protein OEY89_10455 [Gammaproteobacteria bacterium]|nr:hypothetical protein [Gammaproteobacteria bacterium]
METYFRILAILLLLSIVSPVNSEYGDIVLNKRSEKEGIAPVVFSHWFHRIRFRCKVCHSELGFEMRLGSDDVTMQDILEGKFCGLCHNDDISWGVENCDMCHSGKMGLKTQTYGSHETSGPGIR